MSLSCFFETAPETLNSSVEANGAEVEAPQIARVLAERESDLGRSSADVEQQRAFERRRSVQNAETDQARFFAT